MTHRVGGPAAAVRIFSAAIFLLFMTGIANAQVTIIPNNQSQYSTDITLPGGGCSACVGWIALAYDQSGFADDFQEFQYTAGTSGTASFFIQTTFWYGATCTAGGCEPGFVAQIIPIGVGGSCQNQGPAYNLGQQFSGDGALSIPVTVNNVYCIFVGQAVQTTSDSFGGQAVSMNATLPVPAAPIPVVTWVVLAISLFLIQQLVVSRRLRLKLTHRATR